MTSIDEANERAAGTLPDYLGIVFTRVEASKVAATLDVEPRHMAPNGYLHAGTVIALADSAAGFGCIANLPEGARGFTTIELKSNFFGTARDGTLDCTAAPAHSGRTTQVWDATVVHRESGKTIAAFRCTQLVLYPRQELRGQST